MGDADLRFPDIPRGELEKTIRELMERAQRVLTVQGRLRALLEATRVVAEPLDLDQVLIRIVQAAVSLVDARYGALGVRGQDGGLERFMQVGMDSEQVAAIGPLPEWRGLLGAVLDGGRSMRLAHIADDPRSVGFPEHHPPMDSFLAVPIRVRDQSFGSLYLTDHKGGEFSDEDEALIESLAAAAGIAIDNARLYEDARRRERLSRAQSEISAALLDPGTADVLSLVADRLTQVIATELVTIVVPADDDQWRIASACGAEAAGLHDTLIPASSALAARAVDARAVVTGPFTDERTERRLPGERAGFGATAAVPLSAGDRVIGALCVSRIGQETAFTHADLDTIADFAAQAGIAISLAWARRDRQHLEVIEERSRIARDLHDNVIQRLFATGLGLQAVASVDPDSASRLETYIAELDAAISDIRTAIFTLGSHPSTRAASLVRGRLLDVIGELTPALTNAPKITFTGPIDLALVGSIAEDVLAVVREGLANVARHAHAEHVVVDVSVSETAVTVAIDDDGDGVTNRRVRSGGTDNLRRRAQIHSGEFSLGTRPGGGTHLEWCVPLPA